MIIKLTKDTIIGGRLYLAGDNVTVSDSYGRKLVGTKGIKINTVQSSSSITYFPFGW